MSQVQAQTAGAPAPTDRERQYALWVCMAGGFVVFLDFTITGFQRTFPHVSTGSLLDGKVFPTGKGMPIGRSP
jgi:hypothetical protein